jgi:hypothetical protein
LHEDASSHRMGSRQAVDGFDLMKKGESIRSVVIY